MHPIIREFSQTGERLALILEKHYNKDDYLETVFFKLCQAMSVSETDHDLYVELDQALIKGHSDTNIYLLFISFTLSFTSIRKQFDRAKVILSIGNSISLDNFDPIVKAYFIASKAVLSSNEMKISESNHLISEAKGLIDKNHPRYITILSNIGVIIAKQGRLKEFNQGDLDLLDISTDNYRLAFVMDMRLANCIFTGNYEEGFGLIEKCKEIFKNEYKDHFLNKINILNILDGDFDKNNYQAEYYKSCANFYSNLSTGRFEEALIDSNNLKKMSPLYFEIEWPFKKYVPIHIELSMRNIGKSRLLLQEMVAGDDCDYMIDFFFARLQLLEKNLVGAHESYRKLIENINRYGAINRLIFELQFAKEMSPTDLLLLSNGINKKYNEIELPSNKNKPSAFSKEEKGVGLLIGSSAEISQVKKLVKKFASLKEAVLITGETGTGKELVSRAIHEEGPNSKAPFLAINCGSLTETLLQSELFGYEAGAFTGAQKERKGIFESAGKGTVFLDEFGEISPKMQVSLLRVLESNEIRLIGASSTRQIQCKIVIATNVDLKKAVEEKRFREDLYFRLARYDIKLPSLRERTEDIPELINYFLVDVNGIQKKLSNRLVGALIDYRWPGNIRELKNEMERLKILQPEKEFLDIEDFDFTHLQLSINMPLESKSSLESKFNEKQGVNDKVINDRILKIINKPSRIEQRYEFLTELFQQYKKLTRLQIIEIASISPVTASKDLEYLCKTGIIKKVMPTKSVKSHYFIFNE
jgi:DNA-binding NtrC family response regulator